MLSYRHWIWPIAVVRCLNRDGKPLSCGASVVINFRGFFLGREMMVFLLWCPLVVVESDP
jgi:hypothetical protein